MKGSDSAISGLLLAVHGGREDEVRSLLASGLDVNRRDADGMTPLMAAAMNGDVRIARLLLVAGASRDMFNKWGMTARDIAVWHGYGALAELLDEGRGGVPEEKTPAHRQGGRRP